MTTQVKTSEEIAALKESGKMLAEVMAVLKKLLTAGMTTKDLAIIAKKTLKPLGGQPTFLGYQGFPDVICVSLNDEVVHGIPDASRIINEDDVVSMDFGVTYRGMITDSAVTIALDKAPENAKKMIHATEQALYKGIKVIKDNLPIGDISAVIQQSLETGGYGVVRDLVGHGVGHELHEEPNIPNYGQKGEGFKLKKGMSVAIEPMASLGDYKVYTDKNGWAVRTKDGSLSAHFEHTVLVGEKSAEILTQIRN